MPPQKYVDLLKQEISARALAVGPRLCDTIYFGGGTPSLLEPELIVSVIDELANHGFEVRKDAELTIEIDPGTVTEKKLDQLIAAGFNRFSVGAQSFSDRLLKLAGRKHSSKDTLSLLLLMNKKNLNYSFDLLFSLPTQSLDDLKVDLEKVLQFDPSHLSAYCLNVAENHPMNQMRPTDAVQVEMFAEIELRLALQNILRYEISNFAKPGFESKHNLLYWRDHEYWGLGVSAHSYLKSGRWGARFSNPKRIQPYEKQVSEWTSRLNNNLTGQNFTWDFARDLAGQDFEALEMHQALTDFCHTSLRLSRGLSQKATQHKFSLAVWQEVETRLSDLKERGLVDHKDDLWALSNTGKLLANLVFEKLTFNVQELKNYSHAVG